MRGPRANPYTISPRRKSIEIFAWAGEHRKQPVVTQFAVAQPLMAVPINPARSIRTGRMPVSLTARGNAN